MIEERTVVVKTDVLLIHSKDWFILRMTQYRKELNF